MLLSFTVYSIIRLRNKTIIVGFSHHIEFRFRFIGMANWQFVCATSVFRGYLKEIFNLYLIMTEPVYYPIIAFFHPNNWIGMSERKLFLFLCSSVTLILDPGNQHRWMGKKILLYGCYWSVQVWRDCTALYSALLVLVQWRKKRSHLRFCKQKGNKKICFHFAGHCPYSFQFFMCNEYLWWTDYIHCVK